ncbi:reprolysin-like metallopeptidase [Empedobacter tilapiae]
MIKNLITITSLLMMVTAVNAQEKKDVKSTLDTSLPQQKSKKIDLKSVEQKLSSSSLQKNSQLIVSIPSNKNVNEQFVLTERELLNEKMKNDFPLIKSYYGYSITDPSKKISLGYSISRGINALVYSNNDKYIIEKKGNDYLLVDSNNLPSLKNFECGNIDTEEENVLSKTNTQVNNPKTYRKYKLAIATDYDYNKYFSKEGEEPTLENSIAAVNEALTYVLPIYENDLSISFQLADNLDKVTFLTEESNPYFDFFGIFNNLNTETQKQLDTHIGSGNYDLGIVFTNLVGGGNAGAIGSVCNNTLKGSAYMGYVDSKTPEGFSFAVAAAHEMGHQFGANHMHSRNEGRNANREIGSGVTVMGYPGVTGTHDVINTFIPQFQHYNLEQINNYLANQTCGTSTPSKNSAPIADAGKDYVIPKGTAFKLIGKATDADNDNLTYSWEQDDPLVTPADGMNFFNPSSKNTEGANFRIYAHNSNPEQYFPPLENVLNSQLYSTWNNVSDIARDLNFVFQVRDNKEQGGQIAADANIVKVTENGPFKITNINLNQSFETGDTLPIEWDVAGTDGGEINTKNVRIKLTVDNGKTFTILTESTPNNGKASITLPIGLTSEKANIIIEAIDNIYYAASPFIAIGYEVSLSCNQYLNSEPINITDASDAPGITNTTIKVSGETKPIEDISLITDFTHPASNELALLFAKQGVDAMYQFAWYSSCNNADFSYKFNRFGGSTFDNCGVKDAVISGSSLDLERYEGKDANGNYVFRIADLAKGNTGTINKIGVEVCHRETQKLGITDISKQNELAIYPNPTNGNFNIRLNTKTNKVTAEIINLAGQIVSTNTFNISGNKIDQAINATNLPKGVYLVRINDGNSIQTKKLIIK